MYNIGYEPDHIDEVLNTMLARQDRYDGDDVRAEFQAKCRKEDSQGFARESVSSSEVYNSKLASQQVVSMPSNIKFCAEVKICNISLIHREALIPSLARNRAYRLLFYIMKVYQQVSTMVSSAIKLCFSNLTQVVLIMSH